MKAKAKRNRAPAPGSGYQCAMCGAILSLWDSIEQLDGLRVCASGCLGAGLLTARAQPEAFAAPCANCGRPGANQTGTACDECRALAPMPLPNGDVMIYHRREGQTIGRHLGPEDMPGADMTPEVIEDREQALAAIAEHTAAELDRCGSWCDADIPE